MSSITCDCLSVREFGPFSRRNADDLALRSAAIVTERNKFQEMVRERLRLKTPNFSVLSRFLNEDSSTTQKQLKEGGPRLNLVWLDKVSAFYQMSVSEMCSLPGALWQEVKPLEAQLLYHFRQMTELQRHSLLSVLDRAPSQPLTRRRARPGRAELTERQQLVVDLYERSSAKAKIGLMETLRETAKKGDEERAHQRGTETTE